MTRHINKTGLDHIKQWEGLKLTAYLCPAGLWTIGYGHTASAGDPKPKAGMTITRAQADALLKRDLGQYEQAVEKAVKVDLNDHQFAALVSFCYNVGIGAFQKSTLLKKLNKGDYDAVLSELKKWVKAGGKRVEGLANRRQVEVALWIKGQFVSSNYIRPQANHHNPLTRIEAVAPAVGLLSGLGGFLQGAGPVQWALAFVMVMAFLFALWHVLHREKDKRP